VLSLIFQTYLAATSDEEREQVATSLLKIFFYSLSENKYCMVGKFKARHLVDNNSWDDMAIESLKIKEVQGENKDGVHGDKEHAAATGSTEM